MDHGLRGTYYVSMGLMSQTTEAGQMFTADDLHKLVAEGHELGCHTYDHAACRTVSAAETVASCQRNRRAIEEVLPGYKVRNFAFPYGSTRLDAKSALGSAYSTCRGIEPGINCCAVDLTFLRCYSLESADRIRSAIEINTQMNGWVIVYTHDVCATPSTYGCTPCGFREILRCAMASGADILPVADAVAKLTSAQTN